MADSSIDLNSTSGDIDVLHGDSTSMIDILGATADGDDNDLEKGRDSLNLQNDSNIDDDLERSPSLSPIGNRNKVTETSFLDVEGPDEFRGSGTPKGSKSAFSFSENRSVNTPLLSLRVGSGESNQNNYSSIQSHKREHSMSKNMVAQSKSDMKLDFESLEEYRRHRQVNKVVWRYTVISLVINVFLFISKIVVALQSKSLAVAASAVDSFLDLCSQMIIYYALRGSQNIDENKYPVGRSRLEPIGIIVCASLMGIASLQLVWDSIEKLIDGLVNHVPASELVPQIDKYTIGLLIFAILIKLVLFLLCNTMAKESDSMMVLAEDHRNDVLSNAMALGTAYVAHAVVKFWWMDPVGGIAIAVYICVMWFYVAMEQAAMLEGAAAEPEFMEEVREISNTFHPEMYADWVRAYHFGKRYLVEVEVVMPAETNIVHAHDISLELQKKLEKLPQVERAFVHVDYTTRDEDEHKIPYYSTPQITPSEEDFARSKSREINVL